MTRNSSIEDEIRSEFGRFRSLGQRLASAEGLEAVETQRSQVSVSAPFAALLEDPGSPGRPAYARPSGVATTPLLSAVSIVDDIVDGHVKPVTVAMTTAADVVAEGVAAPESTLSYTDGDTTPLAQISHHMPVTTQAIRRNSTLRADVDTFLSGGVLMKAEAQVAAALAAASGMVSHAFDTDVSTTIRTGIAAAQSAFRELGPGEVFTLLSPADHALLDLDDLDTSTWPSTIVSSPALPAGTAYIGRTKLAVQFFASRSSAMVTTGHIDTQFTKNRLTVLAWIDALSHVAAPSAIVRAELTEDLS